MVIQSSGDRVNQTSEHIAPQPQGLESYVVNERPLGTPQRLRIITIGAGASGLNIAQQVGKHMQEIDLQIYDKNADVGGTWLENRYPGCGCDIPSHNYQYTWEPNPNWNS